MTNFASFMLGMFSGTTAALCGAAVFAGATPLAVLTGAISVGLFVTHTIIEMGVARDQD